MAASICTRRACLVKQASQSSPLYVRRWDSSTSGNTPPSSNTRPRSRKQRDVNKVDPKVDLVGPPDPISNIRPMFYASAPSSSSQPSSSYKSTIVEYPHPYSLSEFSQTPNQSSGRRNTSSNSRVVLPGLGFFKGYREYVGRLSDRVEEAEMKLRLSKLTNDRITQRFWTDNNVRFTRDLENWREDSHRRVAALPESLLIDVKEGSRVGGKIESTTGKSSEAEEEMSKDESAFYANWLRANGRRNRAYNVLVWKQAWQQVRLGARVAYLRKWYKTVQALQGR